MDLSQCKNRDLYKLADSDGEADFVCNSPVLPMKRRIIYIKTPPVETIPSDYQYPGRAGYVRVPVRDDAT